MAYVNWDKVIEEFECSEDRLNVKNEKQYNAKFIEWLKRNHTPPSRVFGHIAVNGIKIDLRTRTVNLPSGKTLIPPKRIFSLIAFFCSYPGTAFSRSEIIRSVWEKGVVVEDKTVDVHVNYIRKIMGSDFIQTYKGIGYGIRNNMDSQATKQ